MGIGGDGGWARNTWRAWRARGRQPEFFLLRWTHPLKTTKRSCIGTEKQLSGLASWPKAPAVGLVPAVPVPERDAPCPRLGAVPAELLLSGKLSEYGVIVPFSTDCRGRFLSHVVSGEAAAGLGQPACPPEPARSRSWSRRVPRSPPDESPQRRLLYFNVTVFGKELHLRLRPNRRLLPPGAVAEWQEDFEVLFREPLQQRCLFTGDISGMPGAAVAISNCDGLVSWKLVGCFVCAACVLVWFPLKR